MIYHLQAAFEAYKDRELPRLKEEVRSLFPLCQTCKANGTVSRSIPGYAYNNIKLVQLPAHVSSCFQ